MSATQDHLKARIRRDGVEIGEWDKFQIRQFIATGSLLVSDEYFEPDESAWVPLLPKFRRKWPLFEWDAEDDLQFYYVLEGAIHGPRLAEEILALHASGYLNDETLVAHLGAPDWVTIASLLPAPTQGSSGEGASEHINAAWQAYQQGDIVNAGVSGFKALSKAWNAFTAVEETTTPWLCVPVSESGDVNLVLGFLAKAGRLPVGHEVIKMNNNLYLALEYPSIAEAAQLRQDFTGAELAEGFLLLFENRR